MKKQFIKPSIKMQTVDMENLLDATSLNNIQGSGAALTRRRIVHTDEVEGDGTEDDGTEGYSEPAIPAPTNVWGE